jgi:hypothetical protein
MNACTYHVAGWFYVCHPHDWFWMLNHWVGTFVPWPL